MSNLPGIRLWARVAGAPADIQPASDAEIFSDLRDHLLWLLNTRQGDAPACPDYGLPDILRIVAGLPGTTENFCGAVVSTISKHEPRVSGVRVYLNEDKVTGDPIIRFTIEVALKAMPELGYQKIAGEVNGDAVFRFPD